MTGVSIGRYLLGVASLIVVCGSLGLAALAIRRRYLPDWSGAPARLAEAVTALALLTATIELLGAIGLFRLGPIVAASVLIGFGTARALGRAQDAHARAARGDGLRPAQRPAPAATAVAIAAAAAVITEWAAPTLQSYGVGIRSFDSLWYHLPWAASFAQTGQITPLRFTDVEYLTSFYPAIAESFHGLGIVLLSRDTLSPGLNLIWLGLALLAAYCIGRPRGLGPHTLTAAALAMATPMIYFSQAGSAANDVVGVFFLLAAVALVVNAGGRSFPFALAAVSAGLALAVKLSMLAPVLALTVGVLAGSPRGRRRASGLLWVGPLLLAGSFWYVRNLIAVGNPLPWLSLPALSTPAVTLQAHTAFSVAHYLTNTQILSRVFEPGLAAGLGRWWAVVLALAVIGPVLCLLPSSDGTTRMLGLVALASLGAYLVTPETAAGPAGRPLGFAFNLRYAAPALTLSLAILPLAPVLGAARRAGVVLAGLGIVLVAMLAQARLWPSRHLPGALALGVAVAVLAILLGPGRPAAARALRALRALGGRRRRRLAAFAAVAALLAAGTATAYSWQRHYLRGRYAFAPGVSYLANVWALFREVHDARVGLVGTYGGFFSYPLFGVDDSNRVQYVAQRGPHGSFTPIRSCRRWRTAVNAGRFRYLVLTPARDPWHPRALGPSPEGTWTASDPAARLLYSRRAAGQTIAVYELRGALDPSACP
jgi:hypothetical protein